MRWLPSSTRPPSDQQLSGVGVGEGVGLAVGLGMNVGVRVEVLVGVFEALVVGEGVYVSRTSSPDAVIVIVVFTIGSVADVFTHAFTLQLKIRARIISQLCLFEGERYATNNRVYYCTNGIVLMAQYDMSRGSPALECA